MRTRTYGLDRDTLSYANRIKIGSGKVLDSNAIKQINKFVVGIKRMGLWNSMVCWPMRSIHNAGTGSTVYSLGGLGVYNGVATNSPAWSTQGMAFNGTNQIITCPIKYTIGNSSAVCVGMSYTGTGVQAGMSNGIAANGYSNLIYVLYINSTTSSKISSYLGGWTGAPPCPVGRFNTWGWSQTSNTTANTWGNETYGTSTGSSGNVVPSNFTTIGNTSPLAQGWNGIISISAIFNSVVVDYRVIKNLYRSTLGINLGLT